MNYKDKYEIELEVQRIVRSYERGAFRWFINTVLFIGIVAGLIFLFKH